MLQQQRIELHYAEDTALNHMCRAAIN